MTRIDKDALPSLSSICVLVVDDNEDAREMLTLVLEYCGAVVASAGSAREALALVERFQPQVIVTDLAMPEHDGYWLLAETQKLTAPLGRAVPVLAVTAHDREQQQRALAAGFHAYLPKPLNLRELCDAVIRLVPPPRR
jgi:CheY-like chemotaxis protein